ncbi:GDSL esterase lipase At1g29670-like [Olea europaea subsp. europaea]|uniref:GDSL esterase lipase At1g29670-like n=1 Tax=Olea europaea subsp. europaea TaxID=158383 RepID=A0A8S0P6V1_OLEEU|nr:GDSL esterase lipase At1g29670-like [Olea europaea subsp. europaea]
MGSGGFRISIMISIVVSIIMKSQNWVMGRKQVPCLFLMGDSLFDNGNNNLLITITQAKANYPPYGIDYPYGPPGRFSNGRNIVDYLGFDKPISPFVTTKGSEIRKGVNYGSGGAGILDETEELQVINKPKTLKRKAFEFDKMMGIGDMLLIDDVTPQFYSASRLYTPQQFAHFLIQQYSQQLRTLYNYEARKVAIFGVGLTGCLPSVLAMYPPPNGSTCVESINDAAALFNNKLKSLVDTFNEDLHGTDFIYININGISRISPRDISALEILNQLTAARAYNATLPTGTYPIDIRRLVQQ